jgi:protein SCO1
MIRGRRRKAVNCCRKANRNPVIVGLTGSQAAVEAAQRAAGLPPGKKLALANGNYGMGHAGFVLAYSKDDRTHLIYPSGITVEDWDHDLPLLAAETWSER